MPRSKKLPKTGKNPELLVCKRTKQFQNIIVCTYQCFDRCISYFEKFDIETITNYIESHTEYEMLGVIMPTKKIPVSAVPETTEVHIPVKPINKNEKIYWVITDENQYAEVTESEIINNPAEYFGKPMFEKPKEQYEVVVTIRKKGKV
jgi:protoporphyrinogen oxidase